MSRSSEQSSRLTHVLLWLACLALLTPLLVYAYTGTFSRHRADDFCHSGDIIEHGFWQAQVVVYLNSSDRYSVEPLVGLSELTGTSNVRWLPAAAIFLWLAAAFWSIRQLMRFLNLRLSSGIVAALLAAEMLIFFTLFESPSLFQSLYWRAGMLTYLMPLVVLTVLAGALFKNLARPQRERIPAGAYGLIALLAFFAAGFSETSAALQAGALMLALVMPVWQALRCRRSWRDGVFLGVALAATLLGMLVLFLSPAAHLRQANFDAPPDFLTLVLLSMRFGLDFIIWDTFKVLPLPMLVSVFMAGLLWLSAQADLQGNDVRRNLVALLLTAVVCILLVICCVAPSVYVYQAGMEPRAAISARCVTVIAFLTCGFLMASLFQQLFTRLRCFEKLPLSLLAGLLFLAFAAYPLRAAVQAAAVIPDYRSRAEAWDRRDTAIRSDLANGILDIETVELDSIDKIGDLKDDPDLWVNVCAARFYGARTIRTHVLE